MDRIYLDNAATSWPKPQVVYAAVDRALRELGAPAGRSAYAEAAEVEAGIASARAGVAALIGAADPRQAAFTFNGTDSLNIAIHGVLGDGDHVVTTVAEHNSVLRPLRALEDAGRIEVTRVGSDAAGVIDVDDVRRALRPGTRLVVLTHASNVTGALQPAAEVAALAREHGCLSLLDAAQTLGDLPLDVGQLGIDLLAAPGHKGLLGPLGTGVLYVRPCVEQQVAAFRQGGTGSRSEQDRQPQELPDKYESGNHNVPGILGLGAAVAWLRKQTLAEVRRHTRQLTEQLLAGFADLPGLQVFGPAGADARVGVVSIGLAGYDPQEVAGMLDAACRVQVRSGLHCAPLMHAALGTLEAGGTVRFSIGPFNTAEQIATAVDAVRQLAEARLNV